MRYYRMSSLFDLCFFVRVLLLCGMYSCSHAELVKFSEHNNNVGVGHAQLFPFISQVRECKEGCLQRERDQTSTVNRCRDNCVSRLGSIEALRIEIQEMQALSSWLIRGVIRGSKD